MIVLRILTEEDRQRGCHHTLVIRRFVYAIVHGGSATPTPAEEPRRAEVLIAGE
jgi:hypothetical protein